MSQEIFDDLYKCINDERKLEYLSRLLNEDDTLRINFVKYFQTEYEQLRMASTPAFSIEEALVRIKAQASEVSEVLSGLDFEETDWDSWEGSNHYMKSWEIAQQLAEEEADETWSNLCYPVVETMEHGDLTEIVVEYAAAYLGIEQADINDPHFDLGEDANDYFYTALLQTIMENLQSLEGRPFAISDFENASNLFVAFNKMYFKGNDDFIDSIGPILTAVIQSKSQAEILWEAGKNLGGDSKMPAALLNKVTKLLGDTELWVESLESCFLEDYNTSKELMDYYFDQDTEKFEEEAIRFESKFDRSTHEYLLEKLMPGTSFYIEVLKKHAKNTGSTKILEQLKKYIDVAKLIQYIDSLYDGDIKALFLAHEKAFDKLIALVEETSLTGSSYYSGLNFENAISLLIKDRPAEAWMLVKQKVNSVLNAQRGRNVYTFIATWLKLAQDKLGREADIVAFILEIYNHKPNLPALKDEMRKAGLVRL